MSTAMALGLVFFAAATVIFAFQQTRRRNKAELLARQSEQRLTEISSMSGFGFFTWDAATDRVWASDHARRVLLLDALNGLLGRDVLKSVHPEDRPSVLKGFNSAVASGEIVERELRIQGAAGESRWITARVCVYLDITGKLGRAVGYVVDDGERKRSATELLKMQQKLTHLTRVAMLGELSGALAHELQQPLTAILCNAHAALLQTKKAPMDLQELQEILGEIVSDDKNAGQIIQRLRALLVRGETQFDHLEIPDLLNDVLALSRGTLMERNVQVHTRIDKGMPEVRGDRVELQQVLLNLVLNACESMSTNPARNRRVEIVVNLDGDSDAVRISVLDCGRGIDVEQLEKVFDPFFTTKAGGLGLGLSISHSIIAAHGGRLWASNRSDRGAAFHFTLPATTGKDSHERHSTNSVYC
jgi:signal transduction histidine kinase